MVRKERLSRNGHESPFLSYSNEMCESNGNPPRISAGIRIPNPFIPRPPLEEGNDEMKDENERGSGGYAICKKEMKDYPPCGVKLRNDHFPTWYDRSLSTPHLHSFMEILNFNQGTIK